MKLEQSFEVDAPLERVWQALVDVERVAPCLPGAAVTGRNEDGSYNGTFTIKIGPTTASYAGKLEMQNVDEASHSAIMHAQGSDRRGQGGATATISSRVTTVNGSTRVEVVTDYHITGRLARFGRGGMIEDISERLLREFAGRLQSSLSGGGVQAATGVHEATASDSERAVVGGGTGPEPVPPPTEAVAPAPPPAEPPEGEPAHAALAEPGASGSEEEPRASGPQEEQPTEPFERLAAAPAGSSDPEPAVSPPRQPETQPAPPVQGLSLVGSVLLNRVRRNPKPVIALAGGLLVLGLVRRRRH